MSGRPRIAWYVHHHGRGHLTRLLAVAPHLDADIHCLSSLPEPAGLPPHCTWTVLDRDDEVGAGETPLDRRDPTAGGLLHWAPLGHVGHRRRLAAIGSLLAEERIDALVVDVSMEVVLLGRLLGVPTIAVAQPGIRDDRPHRLGFAAASAILAPWPEGMLALPHLDAVRDRVIHIGGISRFERRPAVEPAAREGVLLLTGRGGSVVTDEAVAEASAVSAEAGRTWSVLGATPGSGWVEDPWEAVSSAEIVVSWAGQNSIADLAAAGAAAVVVPQPRPFDEQLTTARALESAGLAVVADEWPAAADWPALLDRAAALQPDWSRWEVDGASARAAGAILAVAERGA